jgi:hypothetical protein
LHGGRERCYDEILLWEQHLIQFDKIVCFFCLISRSRGQVFSFTAGAHHLIFPVPWQVLFGDLVLHSLDLLSARYVQS